MATRKPLIAARVVGLFVEVALSATIPAFEMRHSASPKSRWQDASAGSALLTRAVAPPDGATSTAARTPLEVNSR
jgi:hypothetical protein